MDPADLLQLTPPGARRLRGRQSSVGWSGWDAFRARKFRMPAGNSGSGVAVFMS